MIIAPFYFCFHCITSGKVLQQTEEVKKVEITEAKETADSTAATEKSAKEKVLNKQLELLSKASETVSQDRELIKYLPALSNAISEICYLLNKD